MIKSVTAAGLVISAAAASLLTAPAATSLAAPAASAATTSTVGVFQTVLLDFHAGAGQRNHVRAEYLGATTADGKPVQRFTVDDVHKIKPGAGCSASPTATRPNRVVCDVRIVNPDDPRVSLRLYLGDGNDSATARVGDQGGQIDGGSGNDKLTVSAGGYLYGRAGNDTLVGGSFADAGDGNDRVRLGNGAEGKALGGRGNDVIRGGNGHDTIFGNSGRDRIYGGRGGDELLGGPDDDTVYGNSGNDGVYGGPGRDKLSGGPGTNTVRQDGPPQQGDQPQF